MHFSQMLIQNTKMGQLTPVHSKFNTIWRYWHNWFTSNADKAFADADVVKVTETKNGWEIKVTGEDSKNCDDYIWEYKG